MYVAPTQLAAVDRVEVLRLLQLLRSAFDRAPVTASPMPWEKALTGSAREAWEAIQATLEPGTVADIDVACLLAYFGVDYRRNARRVLRGCTLRPDRASPRALRLSPAGGLEACARVPAHAARLYHRWRDSAMLDWILAHRRSVPEVQTAENEGLLALWDDHWVSILSAANGHAARRIADALAYARTLVPEGLVWNAYLCHLGRAAGSPDASLRGAALQVLSLLRQRGHVPKP